MQGATFGPYRIDRELGSGGMEKVYAAVVEGRCPGLAELRLRPGDGAQDRETERTALDEVCRCHASRGSRVQGRTAQEHGL